MGEIKLKLRDAIDATLSFATGQKHRITLTRNHVLVLDLEDGHFNLDRSVLLPDLADTDGSVPVLTTRRVTGLGVVFAALVHAGENPAQGLFVSGHTDGSGAASHNQGLSVERAQNVSLLLRGKRDEWRKQAAKDDAVDDFQTILRWQHQRAGWDCDPGEIDDKLGRVTREAIGRFQELYNVEVDKAAAAGKDSPFKSKITVDKKVGPETWGAVFDLYMDELMDLMELTAFADLQQQQAKLHPPSGMPDFVGCGEHIPFNPARRKPFVKTKDELDGPQHNPPDRRVEILFFDPGEEVDLVCHPKPGACEPAKCPLYIKAAHVQTPLGIPKGLSLAEVNLKLTFVDPEGKVRPFPEGLEVEAKFGDPLVKKELVMDDRSFPILDDAEDDEDADENADADGPRAETDASDPPDPGADPDAESEETDQEPNAFVQPGGLLQFVVPRKASSLYLRFLAGDKRFVTADPKTLDDQKLATLDEALEAVGAGRVFFQLPKVFDSQDGYFKGPAGVSFSNGCFQGLDNRQTQLGSRAAPAELRLEIRWQHFQFEYFDRFTSSLASVPQPRSKDAGGAAVPSLVLEGMTFIPTPPANPPSAAARSAWDVQGGADGKATLHCLAWVNQITLGPEKSRVMPDDKTMARFSTDKLFVRTSGDGKSPDAPRAFAVLADADRKKPGLERLRHYDLPDNWWSARYPVRLGGETRDKTRPFEQASGTPSALDKPYVVSLDVIVLDDASEADNKTPTLDDASVENRISLYDNQLRVYKPDADESYFTKVGDLKPAPASPVLMDFPDFTRLITRGSIVYDVFGDRTPIVADMAGLPVGARQATRLLVATNDATTRGGLVINDSPYTGITPDGGNSSFPASIMGLLRCCGQVGGVEQFQLFQYMSVSFDFAPTPKSPDEKPLKTPLTGKAADTKARDCLLAVAKKWNDTPVIFHVDNPETATGRWTFLLSRGKKSPRIQQAEVQVNIFGRRRASQGGQVGNWELDDMAPDGKNRLTAAHELGHALSLPDEYTNTDYEPSLGEANVIEFGRSPGAPYGFDPNGMMGGGELAIRTRNFWHTVLWARERGYFTDAKSVVIEHGAFKFTATLTPRTQNRAEIPAAPLPNVTPGALGLCDAFVFVTGRDGFTAGDLGGSSAANPYDGFITIRVKMAWDFPNTSQFSDMRDASRRAAEVIHQAFNVNKRLVMRGTFEGKAVRLRVLFSPRFVGTKFPEGDGADVYLKSIAFQTLAQMNPNVKTAFAQRVQKNIGAGLHAEIALDGPGAAGIASPPATPRRATVRSDGFFSFLTGGDFDDDTAGAFARLVGLNSADIKTAEDYRPLANTLAGALGAIKLELVS